MTDERYTAVLDEIAQGLTITQACEKVGVGRSTFYRTVDAPDGPDPEGWPGLAVRRKERYAHARKDCADAIAAGMRATARAALTARDAGQVQAYRLIVDTDKWLLSKLAPKEYGDRVDVEHSGSVTLAMAPEDAAL